MPALKSLLNHFLNASRLLPAILTRPALLKLWLKNALKQQIIIIAILAALIFIAPMASSALADALYPPQKQSFGNRFSNLFKSKKNKAPSVHDARQQQFQAGFWIFGSISIIGIIIIDLPRLRRLGKERAEIQFQQAQSIQQSNPELSQTLRLQAQSLVIEPETPQGDEEDDDLNKTYTGPSPVQQQRFVGQGRRYRIDNTIASGGAGIVYSALDTLLERQVALKELFDDVAQDPEQAARFKIEAKALAAFNHPHIVPVYDMFEENSHSWLVMELLTGGDLSQKIKQQGRLTLSESLRIVKGIADGLAYAHAENVVHRDIKPENILFAEDNSFRLTDFGIAKTDESTIKTQQGIILGSPGYMSPEQASGEALDLRSDIYSLGITLFQMLTGKIPFEGETSQVLIKHITQAPPPPSQFNPEIPANIEAIILKMLEKKPAHRYQSCQELILAIEQLT